MAYAESPRVGCAALDRLKVLILEASGTAAGAVLEARPHSLALEGEADATFKPPSSSSTARSVSTGHPETGVAPTAHGGEATRLMARMLHERQHVRPDEEPAGEHDDE
jgi:hypothetical protein